MESSGSMVSRHHSIESPASVTAKPVTSLMGSALTINRSDELAKVPGTEANVPSLDLEVLPKEIFFDRQRFGRSLLSPLGSCCTLTINQRHIDTKESE